MRVVAFKPEHLLAVQMQPAQAHGQRYVTEEMAQAMATSQGIAWSAEHDGHIIACAGVLHMHEARGLAWGMFSQDALAQFKTIHRVVSAVLQSCPWRRVEMEVDCRHAAACRWAEHLGFVREARMYSYTPDGRDCFLYAKVKRGD